MDTLKTAISEGRMRKWVPNNALKRTFKEDTAPLQVVLVSFSELFCKYIKQAAQIVK
jgi:hypothetical protein